jgi:hypothetical protein
MFRTAAVGPRYGVSWLVVLYLVAGGIVAATHHYWDNLHSVRLVGSAVLATLLWPLLLVGIDLHIR